MFKNYLGRLIISLKAITMKIGIPKEIHDGEKRVATTPDVTKQLIKLGFEVVIEPGAGSEVAFF